MKELLKKHSRSPWFPVSLAIVGVVIGYSLVLATDHNVFAAATLSCPNECNGPDCPHNKV